MSVYWVCEHTLVCGSSERGGESLSALGVNCEVSGCENAALKEGILPPDKLGDHYHYSNQNGFKTMAS